MRLLKDKTLFRFEKLVTKTGNTGHLLISAGFSSIGIKFPHRILEIWDNKIGSTNCSCRSRSKSPEILLATSVISHENLISNASDFTEFHARLEHLAGFHQIVSVIGLGINGIKGHSIEFEKLHLSQRNFLKYLQSIGATIGCRGKETLDFLVSCGFMRSKLFVTGCPSLQLIGDFQKPIPENFSKILVGGALMSRFDLLDSMTSESTQILFIPQTVDAFNQVKDIGGRDRRIEIFLPASFRDWKSKLNSFKPEISVGTRLHGNVAAMSLGVPTVFMSGDIRTREITEVALLPFFDDIVEIDTAVKRLTETSILSSRERILTLKNEMIICLEQIV